MIIGLIFLKSEAYYSRMNFQLKCLTCSYVYPQSYCLCFLACSMKNYCSFAGKSSYRGFFLFNFQIYVFSLFMDSYSSFMWENLQLFLSQSYATSNKKVFMFFIYSSYISYTDIYWDLLAISAIEIDSTTFSPRLMEFFLQSSQKYSTIDSSTFSIPSIKIKTPILSEVIPCNLLYLDTMFAIFS